MTYFHLLSAQYVGQMWDNFSGCEGDYDGAMDEDQVRGGTIPGTCQSKVWGAERSVLQYPVPRRWQACRRVLGWETEWKAAHPEGTTSLEQEAISRRAQLLKNKREGAGPRTIQEERAQNTATRKAKAAQLKAEAAAQKTLSEYWKESYFSAAKRSKKENSWVKEEQHFRLWIEPLLGALPLRSIGLKQWDEVVKSLSKNNMSARSKEYITGTLRRILKHAYDRRMIDDAPPSGKRVGVCGPGNNRRLRVISHGEEEATMEHLSISDPHALKITRFAFLTGCRASEAFGLTWRDVDFSRGCITFAETKNHDSRIIPITEPFLTYFLA